ncbi:hypothetical protein HF086_010930 [Spodoptera exigua]|uniref:Guanylate cyclase soluble subunit beta-1 n=1 Tax=Spodoptera exigua TaxID=7107 RepID=A0A922SHN2_SPOEX|nr:hypothetical protein HF086_010930 [Spodoptera exigua]
MYGFVNYALELLVTKTFNEETWETIKKKADVAMEGSFLVRQIYEDEITYHLITAAVEVLQIPADAILELFGKTFFEFCQDSGYDKILQVLGATPRDFLQNLDGLHDHLGTLYPGMRSPSFRCTERPEDGALTVASKLHDTEVKVEILKTKEECDHVQFLITETSTSGRVCAPEMAEIETLSLEPKVSPATFCRVFPFHLMFDRELNIVQAGRTVSRLMPRVTRPGCKITDVLDTVRPHLEMTFANVLAHINTVYVLKTKPEEMVSAPDEDIASLRLKFEADYKLTQNLEVLTDKLQQTFRELDSEKQKTDRLLYSVLPISVATELRHQRPVPARRYDTVTLLFSGIVGFANYCARHTDHKGAMKIVRMLNDLYTAFDVLTDPKRNPNVYKVETVGDKYMAVSGLPEYEVGHAKHISLLALEMMDLSQTVTVDGEPVKINRHLSSRASPSVSTPEK